MIYTLSRCADPLRSAFESHKQSAQRGMRRQAARARREAKRDAALDKWAAKMDKRVKEPFRNTYRYYCPPAALFIVLFFALRDYYHGWAAFGFSFLNISIFWRLPETGAALALDIVFTLAALAVQIAAIVFAVKAVKVIVKVNRYKAKYDRQTENYMKREHSICFIGPPGSGKSVSAGDVAVHVAARRWRDLQIKYATEKWRLPYYERTGQTEKIEDFFAIEESYLFFKRNERRAVPCLATSIGMKVKGRYTYKATPLFFVQHKRVAEYTVIFDDESGATKGSDTSKAASKRIKLFYRFVRHFGDFIIIMTEQNSAKNADYIRSCLDNNIYCYCQEWVMEPERLGKKISALADKVLGDLQSPAAADETRRAALRRAKRLYYLNEYRKSIGFRRIRRKNEGNTERTTNVYKDSEETIVLPSRPVFDYDDRAYRRLYKAGGQVIDMEIWQRLSFGEEDDFDRYEKYITEQKPRAASSSKTRRGSGTARRSKTKPAAVQEDAA